MSEHCVDFINSIKSDLKAEVEAELKEELIKQIFEENKLVKAQSRFNEMDCNEVQQCVVDDFTQINSKLIEDDIKILQNKAMIDQV